MSIWLFRKKTGIRSGLTFTNTMSIPLSSAMTGRVNLIFSKKKAARSFICRERRKFPAQKSKPNSTRSKDKRTGYSARSFYFCKKCASSALPVGKYLPYCACASLYCCRACCSVLVLSYSKYGTGVRVCVRHRTGVA